MRGRQKLAVQLVRTMALDLVRGSNAAARETQEGREAGTETRLTFNRSNTINSLVCLKYGKNPKSHLNTTKVSRELGGGKCIL